jgi:putative ABC transport system ATP-binding protein
MAGTGAVLEPMAERVLNGALIDLRDVVKTYKTGAGDVTVLEDITLQVKPGEFVSVVGPSGSGKSTLLNMITGVDLPTSGEVYVGGKAVHTLSQNQLARWRGRNVGVVFQFFQLLPTLTILENVILPMDFCSVYRRRERKARAMRLLEQMGIAGHAHKLPSALSGGEQQRAAIARALANDPPLVVADEPTGNLDTATANEMFALFEELVAQGKTLLIVTHDRSLSARTGRVLHLLDGRLHRDESNGEAGKSARGVQNERHLAQSLARLVA